MRNLKIVVSAVLLFAVLAGIGYALTPPPPPPPPVPQSLGLYDTTIDTLVTTAIDQSACRSCHQTSGTNISGGYNNTVGGVPTRHHSLLPRSVINPLTNAPFGCGDCHPSTPGVGNGILLDRSCVNCHNGTTFYANNIGGHVGNISRPHHVVTNYTSVTGFGNPAQNRTCDKCHGSFVENYNDGHYKPSYATDFMITPYATFKATNTSQPDGLGGSKTWGGCFACHLANPAATPSPIGENHDNHHKEIVGFAEFGGQTPYQNKSTPGETCSWCHVLSPGTTTPLTFSMTNPFTSEVLTGVMELRNSTIEATSVLEPGTSNITVNGTGCEKCHAVKSLHNVQFNYSQNGPQGKGHINNNLDCYGCHNSWLPATDLGPAGPIVPTMDSVSPSVMAVNTAATLTITGTNFKSGGVGGLDYTSVVTVDGVTYTPTSITDTQIVVNIPALSAGSYQLQVVKNGNTLSKLSILVVVPNVKITSAKLSSGVITITGLNFGSKPANAQYYVSVNHGGNQIRSNQVNSWSSTQIKAKNSAAAIGDWVTVMTKDAGEVKAVIT